MGEQRELVNDHLGVEVRQAIGEPAYLLKDASRQLRLSRSAASILEKLPDRMGPMGIGVCLLWSKACFHLLHLRRECVTADAPMPLGRLPQPAAWRSSRAT